MNISKEKIQEKSETYHFTAYSLSFLAYGRIIYGIGPLVPYLSEKLNIKKLTMQFYFLADS